MENLNAEEVKRALECCQHSDSEDNYCINCPYYAEKYCAAKISTDALALITSQEQRIKELAEENERLRAEVSVNKKLLDKCADLEDKVKADTVRDFAERLKNCDYEILTKETIDQIAKEILEGKYI